MICLASSSDPCSAAQLVRLYDEATTLARIGAWQCDLGNDALTWTAGVYDLFEIARGSALHRPSIVDLYENESRAQMERMRAEAIRAGGSFTLDARIRTASGGARWMRLTAGAVHENGRLTRLFGTKQDITPEKDLWDRLTRLAEQDSLTGLANRRLLEARYAELSGRSIDATSEAALVLVDLDSFKEINDRLGHAAGDECLRQIASRLERIFPDGLAIARVGGDEFAVLLHLADNHMLLEQRLVQALAVLGQPVPWRKARIAMGVSIGATRPRRRRGTDLARLFAEADSALYLAKAGGRNTIRIFGQRIRRQRPTRAADDLPLPVLMG